MYFKDFMNKKTAFLLVYTIVSSTSLTFGMDPSISNTRKQISIIVQEANDSLRKSDTQQKIYHNLSKFCLQIATQPLGCKIIRRATFEEQKLDCNEYVLKEVLNFSKVPKILDNIALFGVTDCCKSTGLPPVKGNIIAYINRNAFENYSGCSHAGIAIGNDLVVSKWGLLPFIMEHGLYDVPLKYGTSYLVLTLEEKFRDISTRRFAIDSCISTKVFAYIDGLFSIKCKEISDQKMSDAEKLRVYYKIISDLKFTYNLYEN